MILCDDKNCKTAQKSDALLKSKSDHLVADE